MSDFSKRDNEKTDPGFTTPKAAKAAQNLQAQAPIAPNVVMPDLGPLNALIRDARITEVMINDTRNVMVETAGKLAFSGLAFRTNDELNRTVRTLLDVIGKPFGIDNPIAEGSLPDGSRVHIIGPPLTHQGPCVTIRKFPARRMTMEDLITSKMLDRRMGYFLNASVVAKSNILVAGGTGSGKTTLLNSCAQLIPRTDRIITIEDIFELELAHSSLVRLQTRQETPNLKAITARDLLAQSLRMRPDRIIVGECRRGEAFDMLQAMNTGHAGSMTTLHANSARDALHRVETLCMLAGSDLPLAAIRRQIAAAIDLIVYVERSRDGARRVIQITELTGMEQEVFTLSDLFILDETNPAAPRFRTTGLRPKSMNRFKEHGISFPNDYFA